MSKTPPGDDIAQLAAEAYRQELGSTLTADRMALFVAWSRETFGPTSMRTAQLSDHIRKELDEIAAVPSDPVEWVDVMILAFDGAWRSLQETDDARAAQRVLSLFQQKVASNFNRSWPDWRTADPTKAVEHIRDES